MNKYDYENIPVRHKTKVTLDSIVLKGATYDEAVNALIEVYRQYSQESNK